MINLLIKQLILMISTFVLIGCGADDLSSKDENQSMQINYDSKQQAFNKIKQYANSKGNTVAPNIEDYKAIGITRGIDTNLVAALNNQIAELDANDVDTTTKINNIISNIEIQLDKDAVAPATYLTMKTP